jgi:hypothetical protein
MYEHLKYVELKRLCAARGLGGQGTRPELEAKLAEYDEEARDVTVEGEFVAVDRRGQPLIKKIPAGMTITDPDPNNLNYDLGGKWRRRPPNFVAWNDDGTPILRNKKAVTLDMEK